MSMTEPEPQSRPITVDELLPFFTEAGRVHLDLALANYRIAETRAIAAQQLDAERATIAALRESLEQAIPTVVDPLGVSAVDAVVVLEPDAQAASS